MGLLVPMLAKRSEIFEGLRDGHPWIKGDLVGDVSESALDGDFVRGWVKTKDANGPRRGFQEIEQAAFHDGG